MVPGVEVALMTVADKPVPVESVRADEARRTGLDAARILAALGIVWTHANADAEYASPAALGRFAVPFFSVVAGIFLVDTLRDASWSKAKAFLIRRAGKLYIPFIAWTIIYIAFRMSASMVVSVKDPFQVRWWLPLTGSMYHLWFLPFLLIATIILTPLLVFALRRRAWSLILAAVLITGGLLIVRFPFRVSAVHTSDHFYFLDRVSARSPALLWGTAIGLLIASDPRSWRVSRFMAVVGFGITAFCMGVYWQNGRTPWAANLGGVGWLLVGLGIDRTAVSRWLSPLGRLSYGIYLIHPLIIAIVYKLWAVQHWPQGPLEVTTAFFAATLVSVGATKFIKSGKSLAWLTP